MKRIVALLSLVLICAVSADENYKCSGPQVWEAKMQQSFMKMGISVPYARMSFDGENRRLRKLEVVQNGTEKTTYDLLYYQCCNILFSYNFETKECQRIKTDYPWEPTGVPENATYLGDAYAGSAGVPQGGLLIQTWAGHRSEQGGFNYMYSLTRHGCIPMSYTVWGEEIGLVYANFYDVVLGIDDPNVFRPPQACFDQGQVQPEDMQYINTPVATKHIRSRMAQQTHKHSKLYKLLRSQNNVLR